MRSEPSTSGGLRLLLPAGTILSFRSLDEHPIAPDKIQILAQVERALEWLGVDVAGNSKSDVHQSIALLVLSPVPSIYRRPF
jgi:hypothetical protein